MKEQEIINHINSHHFNAIVAFCKKFGSFKNPRNVRITNINKEGMEITCDGGIVFVPFLQKASNDYDDYQKAIIALYNGIDVENKLNKISKDMICFIDGLKSVVISSVHHNMRCVGSYAPFVREKDDIFICISEVAEHFQSIKENPNKVSLLFLEDESVAKTIFARKRLSIRGGAIFIDDIKQKNIIFDKLSEKNPNESVINRLREMKDFHIVKITLKDGRYVKGFGAAYNCKGLTLTNLVSEKNPHRSDQNQ